MLSIVSLLPGGGHRLFYTPNAMQVKVPGKIP